MNTNAADARQGDDGTQRSLTAPSVAPTFNPVYDPVTACRIVNVAWMIRSERGRLAELEARGEWYCEGHPVFATFGSTGTATP